MSLGFGCKPRDLIKHPQHVSGSYRLKGFFTNFELYLLSSRKSHNQHSNFRHCVCNSTKGELFTFKHGKKNFFPLYSVMKITWIFSGKLNSQKLIQMSGSETDWKARQIFSTLNLCRRISKENLANKKVLVERFLELTIWKKYKYVYSSIVNWDSQILKLEYSMLLYEIPLILLDCFKLTEASLKKEIVSAIWPCSFRQKLNY